MNERRFKGLLWAWVTVFGLRFVTWPSYIPADVEAAYTRSLSESSSPPGITVFLAVPFLLLLFVGVNGMFRFWKPAPYFFISAPLLAFLTAPLLGARWIPMSGWESMFEGVAALMAGLIFAIAVLGPARGLFELDRSGVARM